MTPRVLVIPGDGIGQEVMPAAVRVLQAVAPQVQVRWGRAGWQVFEREGTALPEDTWLQVQEADAVLFGATASPARAVPGYRSPILTLRRRLRLCANVRPVRNWPGVASHYQGIDLVIVRENCEGLYVQEEREPRPGVAEAVRRITREGARRVARTALAWARRRAERRARPARLTVVHKANVLPLTDGLFRDVVRHEALTFPQVQVDERLVDAAALDLVRRPQAFDVLVAPNLYGDVLSDLAAGLVGGLGLAPSANLGEGTPVFEPVHGAAPDIAGQGIANPMAAMLCAAMALDHLGLPGPAQRLVQALERTLARGYATPDLGGRETTASFTEQVLRYLAG